MKATKIDRIIQRAPWIASRTYKSETGEFLSAISNARTHQFITMEAEAAQLWKQVEEGISLSDLQHRARLVGVAGELDTFISSLDKAYLINPELGRRETAFVQADVPPDPKVDPNEPGARAYEQAELNVQSWVRGNGYLYAFFWELTYRCNERCIHCFNPGAARKPGDRNRRNTNELTKKEMIELLDDMVEVGVFK